MNVLYESCYCYNSEKEKESTSAQVAGVLFYIQKRLNMRKREFRRQLAKRRGIQLGDYYIFHNLELYDSIRGESIYFESFEALLNHKIEGIRLSTYIRRMRAGDLEAPIND